MKSEETTTKEGTSESVASKPRRSGMIWGIIHIILAAFSFSLMTMFLKLAGDLPTMEKAFFRNLVALFLAI